MTQNGSFLKLRTIEGKEVCSVDLDYKKLTTSDIDSLLEKQKEIVECQDAKVRRLICDLDKFDYMLAAACGLISGIIGATCLNTNISLDYIRNLGSDIESKKIIDKAKKKMSKNPNCDLSVLDGPNGLEHAVHYFEKTKSVGDGVHKEFGNDKHHFYDSTHECSIHGLFSYIKAELTGKVDGIDPVTGVHKPFISGESGSKPMTAANVWKAAVNWSLHIASDMFGTSSTIAKHVAKGEKANIHGTGVPGPILSLLKRLASIPAFNDGTTKNKLTKDLEYLFFEKHFDVRSEVGLGIELGKMTLAVTINDVLVHLFFFLRRFITIQLNEGGKGPKDFIKSANQAIKFKPRDIKRLLTVSRSVMLICNLANATIRSHGNIASFAVHLNYAQVGAFTVSCLAEGINELKLQNNKAKLIKEINEYIRLYNLKTEVLYKNTWLILEDSDKCMNELIEYTAWVEDNVNNHFIELQNDFNELDSVLNDADADLKTKMFEELEKD